MRSLVEPFDDRWERVIDGIPHDIHHTAGYHRYVSATENSEAFLLMLGNADRGLVWPYSLRRISDVPGLQGSDARDIGSLHGYTGPLTWGVAPGDSWLVEAWTEVLDVWRSQGAVSTFARFHPLLGNHALSSAFTHGAGAASIFPSGVTVSIDCTLEQDDAEADYARVTRQEIARARRAGLTTDHDEDWRHLDTFVRLHEATMDRNDATADFRVSADDIRLMRHELGDHLQLLTTRHQGEVIAAGLFTECGGIVEALMVGVDDTHRRHSPLKVLLDGVRSWARRRGSRVLHLGGGRGGRDDSLLAFKGRFSKRRHQLHTGRWIIDAAAYQELTKALRRHAQTADRWLAAEDWFPAYRAPLVARPAKAAAATT